MLERGKIMFCPECGKKLEDDSTFCEYCGAKIEDESEIKTEEPAKVMKQASTPSEAGKGGTNNQLLTIIAAIALIAVLGVVLFVWMGKRNPKDPGESQETAQQSQETEQVAKEESSKSEKESAGAVEENVGASDQADTTEETVKEDTAKEETASDTSSEAQNEDFSQGLANEPITPVSIDDFDWRSEGMPVGLSMYSDIDKASGKWKCIIDACSEGDISGRVLLAEGDIQHHGNIVTVYLDVKERYEYPADNPSDLQAQETTSGVVMQLSGDWNETTGVLDASSSQSSLRIVLNQFGESDTKEYSTGIVYNGDKAIGSVSMIRP